MPGIKPPICFLDLTLLGGGPLPLLNDPGHKDLNKSMTTKIPRILGLGTETAPKAIVLVTAHWTTDVPTVSSGKAPKLLYDFSGFPPESYNVKYDAPGSPEIAKLVADTLTEAGLRPELDEERGMFYLTVLKIKSSGIDIF